MSRNYPLNVVDREAFLENEVGRLDAETLNVFYRIYVGYVIRFLIEEQMIEPTVLEEAEQIAILKNENALTPTALAERFNHCVSSALIKPKHKEACYNHFYCDPSIEENFLDVFKPSKSIDSTLPVEHFDNWELFPSFHSLTSYCFEFPYYYPSPPPKGKVPLWATIGIAITCISILLVCIGSYVMNDINNYYHPPSKSTNTILQSINDVLHSVDENVYIETPWSPESPTYEAFDDLNLIAQLEASISDSSFMKQVETVPINPAKTLALSKAFEAEDRADLLKVTDILNSHDWQKLEYYEVAQRYRKSPFFGEAHYSEAFFDQVVTLGVHQPEQFDLLISGWKQARQNDIVPYLAEAAFHIDQGFKRRGGAFANNTSQQALDSFDAEMLKAHEALQGLEKLEGSPSHWYYYYLKPKVTFWVSGRNKQGVRTLTKGIQKFPSNPMIARTFSYMLAERWYGEPHELDQYITWYVKKVFDKQHFSSYVDLLRDVSSVETMNVEKLREQSYFNWEWIKQGILEELKTKKPTMAMLNSYAFLATVCNKPTIAAYFFEKTGNHNWYYFHGRKEFDRWQTWAKQATLVKQKNFV
jgi:hypothetical protein